MLLQNSFPAITKEQGAVLVSPICHTINKNKWIAKIVAKLSQAYRIYENCALVRDFTMPGLSTKNYFRAATYLNPKPYINLVFMPNNPM